VEEDLGLFSICSLVSYAIAADMEFTESDSGAESQIKTKNPRIPMGTCLMFAVMPRQRVV